MSDAGERAATSQRAGRLVEAAALYRQALEQRPDHVVLLNNFGAVLDQLGRHGEALATYRRAASVSPQEAVPHFNLGEALLRAGQPSDAIASLRAAATLDPGLHPAWAALGAAHLALGQPTAALGPLRRAVALGEDAESRRHLGDALQLLGRFDEALPFYSEATRLDVGLAAAWHGMGRALLAQERPAEALSVFARCLEADPGHAAAWHDGGKAQFQLGCVEEAMSLLRRAAREGPPDVQERARENLAVIVPGSPDDDEASILETRRQWAANLPSRRGPRLRRRAGGPLRVGYVSAFFHRANWMKPVWAVVNHHDRSRIQVHLFADAPEGAAFPGHRPHPTDRLHLLGTLDNDRAAALIRREEIDVLIDLNGYSAPRRLALFALRPAPIQAGWFNHYGTSGLAALDYIVGDCHVVTPGEEGHYVERVERVPGSYLAFEVDHPVPIVTPLPMLATGHATIGCLASQYKITAQVVATWSEILRRSPQARLLLRNGTLGQPENRDHLLGRFAACGIDADRLVLEGPAAHLEFLATYGRIDFALDPFPYSGGTTTMEAIWQGVPVVTFDAGRWAGRTSLSLLRAAGLDDFVATDRDGYVKLAVQLASSPDRLAGLRPRLRESVRTSAACDGEGLARALEACYARWTAGPLQEVS